MKLSFSSKLIFPVVIGTLGLVGCVKKTPTSGVDVTHIDQSSIKKQSIGNCWAYAVSGWAESLHKTATGHEVDISESYITWWASYYDLLENKKSTEVETGGSWTLASSIFLKHGYLEEGEFIPDEGDASFSSQQKKAIDYINSQLKSGGYLEGKKNRTPERITTVLNTAFGVDMSIKSAHAHSAKDFVIGKKGDKTISLADALDSDDYRWTEVDNQQEYYAESITTETQTYRLGIYRRVQKALNDHMPVIMSFMVGFDALDPADGMFKLDRYKAMKSLGRQGGHMVVLSDYAVDNVPGYGSIGEGDVDQKMKDAALQGDIRYFKVKNSWGIDRPERGITDGYTKISMDYLNANLPWEIRGENTDPVPSSALTDFVLPPGY